MPLGHDRVPPTHHVAIVRCHSTGRHRSDRLQRPERTFRTPDFAPTSTHVHHRCCTRSDTRLRVVTTVIRMRLTYDPEADAAYIYLTDEVLMPGRDSVPCDAPDGDHAMVVLDWKDGKIVGLEVLDASARLHQDLLAQAVRTGE